MKIQSYFADQLGSKILHIDGDTERELILDKVSLSILTCYGEDQEPINVIIKECRIIVNNKEDAINSDLPLDIVVVRTSGGKYVPMNDLVGPSDAEKLATIRRKMYSVFHINSNQFFHTKTRKRDIVWPRQLYMTILQRILFFLHAKAGAEFGRDHATALHSARKVDDFIEMDREWKELFYPIFRTIQGCYGERADKAFNMDWLKDYHNNDSHEAKQV